MDIESHFVKRFKHAVEAVASGKKVSASDAVIAEAFDRSESLETNIINTFDALSRRVSNNQQQRLDFEAAYILMSELDDVKKALIALMNGSDTSQRVHDLDVSIRSIVLSFNSLVGRE